MAGGGLGRDMVVPGQRVDHLERKLGKCRQECRRILAGSRAFEEFPDAAPGRGVSRAGPAQQVGLLLHPLVEAVDARHAKQRDARPEIVGAGLERLEVEQPKDVAGDVTIGVAYEVPRHEGHDGDRGAAVKQEPYFPPLKDAPVQNRVGVQLERLAVVGLKRRASPSLQGRNGFGCRPQVYQLAQLKIELERGARAAQRHLHHAAPLIRRARADSLRKREHGARDAGNLIRPREQPVQLAGIAVHPLRKEDALGPGGRMGGPLPQHPRRETAHRRKVTPRKQRAEPILRHIL